MAIVTRTTETRDAAINNSIMSLGGLIVSGSGVVNQYSVVQLDGATGKWEPYAVGTYVLGEKLGITREEVDATSADAGTSILLSGQIKRDSVDTEMTTALEAVLMQSQLYLV